MESGAYAVEDRVCSVSDAAAVEPTQFEDKYLSASRVQGWLIDRFFRTVGRVLNGLAPRSVLEVGCGAGHSTRRLRDMLPTGVAMEASDVLPENIARARRIAPDVPARVESIYELDRPDRSVDVVVCMEVLEHLDEPRRALAELARVARVGAVLTVPREPIWRMMNMARGSYLRDWGNTPGHVNHWSGKAFRKTVCGFFRIQAVQSPLPWTVICATHNGSQPRSTRHEA